MSHHTEEASRNRNLTSSFESTLLFTWYNTIEKSRITDSPHIFTLIIRGILHYVEVNVHGIFQFCLKGKLNTTHAGFYSFRFVWLQQIQQQILSAAADAGYGRDMESVTETAPLLRYCQIFFDSPGVTSLSLIPQRENDSC